MVMDLEQAFRAHRHYVRDLAFRMLGSIAEAEDVTQEAYVRLLRTDASEIDDVRGWLVVVAGRLCLDHLRSARVRHEDRRDEPGEVPSTAGGPADRVTLDDHVRNALFVVVERLTPAERGVFVLHDVFGFDFEAVAGIVGRTPAACRQLASRARKHVRDATSPARFSADPAAVQRVADGFIAACAGGDLDALLHLLDPEVVGVVDGSGRRFRGRDIIAANLLRLFGPSTGRVLVSLLIDGAPGILAFDSGELIGFLTLESGSSGITHIDALTDRTRLHGLVERAGIR